MSSNNMDRFDIEALSRWEGEGGALGPQEDQPKGKTPFQDKDQEKRPRNILELSLVALAVIIAHLLPLAGALGWSVFAVNGCHAIAVEFSLLGAFLLTTRVLFQDNHRIVQSLPTRRMTRMWLIEAIGAAMVIAWLAPFYSIMHGIAEVSIAAMGIAISILASAVVNRPASWLNMCHDLASVMVVGFAFAWSQTVPHFSGTLHGEEFLGAVAIGSGSLHSLRMLIEATAKYLAT